MSAKTPYDIIALYYPGTEHRPEWDIVERAFPKARPLLGWYDEGDPENVDWQIRWAVEHGIGTFSVCWYWNKGEQRLDHWVKAFYKAKLRSQMKWFMMYANHNQPRSHSTADQEAVTRFWIENYFNTPEYRRIDGKPVVAYCTAYNLDNDFIAEAAERGERLLPGEGIRRALGISDRIAREAGLSGIYWVNVSWLRNEMEWNFTQEHTDWIRRAGFAAEMSYNLGGPTPMAMAPEAAAPGDTPHNVRFEAMAAAALKLAGHADDHADLPFWPTLPTGYDDTSRAFQNAWRVYGRTPEKFREVCEAIREVCERKGLRRIVVAPVNEWQEGSYAEPNDEFGFAMYDAIRDTFCEKPAGGWPPNVAPADIGLPLREYPQSTPSPTQWWDFSESTQGWYRQPFGTPVVLWRDEALHFVTTRAGLFQIRRCLVPFDARLHSAFRVRMRISPSQAATLPEELSPKMSLKWGTDDAPIVSSRHEVDFTRRVASASVIADGQWHEYSIDLGNDPLWRGRVDELWFEAVNLVHAVIDIAWMGFAND